jgi:hypothetical protein
VFCRVLLLGLLVNFVRLCLSTLCMEVVDVWVAGRGIPGEPSTLSVAYAVASFMSASQHLQIEEQGTSVINVGRGELVGIALFQGLEDEVLPVGLIHRVRRVTVDSVGSPASAGEIGIFFGGTFETLSNRGFVRD